MEFTSTLIHCVYEKEHIFGMVNGTFLSLSFENSNKNQEVELIKMMLCIVLSFLCQIRSCRQRRQISILKFVK